MASLTMIHAVEVGEIIGTYRLMDRQHMCSSNTYIFPLRHFIEDPDGGKDSLIACKTLLNGSLPFADHLQINFRKCGVKIISCSLIFVLLLAFFQHVEYVDLFLDPLNETYDLL